MTRPTTRSFLSPTGIMAIVICSLLSIFPPSADWNGKRIFPFSYVDLSFQKRERSSLLTPEVWSQRSPTREKIWDTSAWVVRNSKWVGIRYGFPIKGVISDLSGSQYFQFAETTKTLADKNFRNLNPLTPGSKRLCFKCRGWKLTICSARLLYLTAYT